MTLDKVKKELNEAYQNEMLLKSNLNDYLVEKRRLTEDRVGIYHENVETLFESFNRYII